jgi:hypothetical protein
VFEIIIAFLTGMIAAGIIGLLILSAAIKSLTDEGNSEE